MTSNRMDRVSLYTKSNMNLRLAMAHLTNAIKETGIAEILHPSRQAAHLDLAVGQLDEVLRCFQEVRRVLLPMQQFVPAYARVPTPPVKRTVKNRRPTAKRSRR